MKNLLIYGAGAVGRAFLPWVFPPDRFRYWFVDKNSVLVAALREYGCRTYRVRDGKYEALIVKSMAEPPVEFDAVLTAVGPRNFMGLSDRLMGTTKPVICCENDRRLPKLMSDLTGNPNIFFGIPSAITSTTATAHMLERDRYSIITEAGPLYVEQGAKALGGDAMYLTDKRMHREWMLKLYVHNTAHCIAAYLGWKEDCYWISQAMAIPKIKQTVEGAMAEAVDMIATMYAVDRMTAKEYAAKESARFSNKQLFDPIERVAREPLRKLARGDRLIGAAMLCLQAGFVPANILQGIVAALHYVEPADPDSETMAEFEKMSAKEILVMLNIGKKEPIYQHLIKAIQEGA